MQSLSIGSAQSVVPIRVLSTTTQPSGRNWRQWPSTWTDQIAISSDATSRLVQLTLDALPGRYGDVLEWKYIHGLAVVEIAARLIVVEVHGGAEPAVSSTL